MDVLFFADIRDDSNTNTLVLFSSHRLCFTNLCVAGRIVAIGSKWRELYGKENQIWRLEHITPVSNHFRQLCTVLHRVSSVGLALIPDGARDGVLCDRDKHRVVENGCLVGITIVAWFELILAHACSDVRRWARPRLDTRSAPAGMNHSDWATKGFTQRLGKVVPNSREVRRGGWASWLPRTRYIFELRVRDSLGNSEHPKAVIRALIGRLFWFKRDPDRPFHV